MIAWFYSVARIWTGVTTSDQQILEGTKTIVDTSNRFRVVSDVVCDDFMQYENLLDVEQVPSRLAAPCGAMRRPPRASEFVDTAIQHSRFLNLVPKSEDPSKKTTFLCDP